MTVCLCKKACICAALAFMIFTARPIFAQNLSGTALRVTLTPPAGSLKMGDTPVFRGAVTNLGSRPMQGLIVYLSLVSLEPGQEHPIDLEDWSAQKAVRIERLDPGAAQYQNWEMRLIQAGRFGAALTVINPEENKPVISSLITFEVQPKPTLSRGRILPVAIGVPLLLLALLGIISYSRLPRRYGSS